MSTRYTRKHVFLPLTLENVACQVSGRSRLVCDGPRPRRFISYCYSVFIIGGLALCFFKRLWLYETVGERDDRVSETASMADSRR